MKRIRINRGREGFCLPGRVGLDDLVSAQTCFSVPGSSRFSCRTAESKGKICDEREILRSLRLLYLHTYLQRGKENIAYRIFHAYTNDTYVQQFTVFFAMIIKVIGCKEMIEAKSQIKASTVELAKD